MIPGVIDDNAFIELVPCGRVKLPDVFQIYATTRGREAMPLLRYHTRATSRAEVSDRFPVAWARGAGNLHFRPDGSLVSPTDIDAALPADFACWHYSLVQTAADRWDFHYVGDQVAGPEAADGLAGILGEDVRVNAFRRKFLTGGGSEICPPEALGPLITAGRCSFSKR